MHGKPITDDDMPDGMVAQPDQGDIEEFCQAVMVDVEPSKVMPPAMDDKSAVKAIEREHKAMLDDLGIGRAQRDAVAGQERADDAAAMAETRAEESTGLEVDREIWDGFDSDFGVSD